MNSKFSFPLKHSSVRVPWHDSGWICKSPALTRQKTKVVIFHQGSATDLTFGNTALPHDIATIGVGKICNNGIETMTFCRSRRVEDLKGTLLITRDQPDGGIDSKAIAHIIETVFRAYFP